MYMYKGTNIYVALLMVTAYLLFDSPHTVSAKDFYRRAQRKHFYFFSVPHSTRSRAANVWPLNLSIDFSGCWLVSVSSIIIIIVVTDVILKHKSVPMRLHPSLHASNFQWKVSHSHKSIKQERLLFTFIWWERGGRRRLNIINMNDVFVLVCINLNLTLPSFMRD